MTPSILLILLFFNIYFHLVSFSFTFIFFASLYHYFPLLIVSIVPIRIVISVFYLPFLVFSRSHVYIYTYICVWERERERFLCLLVEFLLNLKSTIFSSNCILASSLYVFAYLVVCDTDSSGGSACSVISTCVTDQYWSVGHQSPRGVGAPLNVRWPRASLSCRVWCMASCLRHGDNLF